MTTIGAAGATSPLDPAFHTGYRSRETKGPLVVERTVETASTGGSGTAHFLALASAVEDPRESAALIARRARWCPPAIPTQRRPG